MAHLQLLCAFAVLCTQLSLASAQGCSATCDDATGELNFEGVDDVVLVDGPDTISLKNEVENLVVMLSSTKASVEGATAIVDAAVKENLNSTRVASEKKLDHLLYVSIRDRINAQRLAIRKERDLLNKHLECGRDGLIWLATEAKCIPAVIPACGPLPVESSRSRSLIDCTGIIGTECATHCNQGWSGENVTYTCTGKSDDNGGWKRIVAHGKLSTACENVNECAYPDYPCNHNSFKCEDTAGSFVCSCDETMVESEEKVDVWPDGAPNGFGAECVCASNTQWLLFRDEHPPLPYCTCPFGGQVDMILGDDGKCDCPEQTVKLPNAASYPTVGLNGMGVTNKNNENKNHHCVYLKDCQHAYNMGVIPSGRADTREITVRAPGGQNRMVTAFCVTERLSDTTGQWKSHTTIDCNHLNGRNTRSYSCRHTNYATNYDTCKEHGYLRAPFRSNNHYMKVISHMGYTNSHYYHHRTIHGVYSWRNWAYSHWYWWWRGGGWPMKSYGGGRGGGFRSWWRSIDNGPWWMANGHKGEPNGDYYANANLRTSWGYIQTWGYSYFNDHRNYGWTGGDYTCGAAYY